jgi:hypothetical protein
MAADTNSIDSYLYMRLLFADATNIAISRSLWLAPAHYIIFRAVLPVVF